MRNVKMIGMYNNGMIMTADDHKWIYVVDWTDQENPVYTDEIPGNLTSAEQTEISKRVTDALARGWWWYDQETDQAYWLAEALNEPLQEDRVKIEYYYEDSAGFDNDYYVFGEGMTFKDWLIDNEIPFEQVNDTDYYLLDDNGERTGAMYRIFSETITHEQIRCN